jgi:hypothetical protein
MNSEQTDRDDQYLGAQIRLDALRALETTQATFADPLASGSNARNPGKSRADQGSAP